VAGSYANLLEQKEVLNSYRIGFLNQHGRRFIVLERHCGCRDVMRWWFLKSSFIIIFNKLNSNMTDDCHILFFKL